MTTTVRIPATKAAKRIPMTSTRKTALVAGVCYLITFVSIPTLALYGPVKNHRDWVISSGSHTGVLVGGFLEVIVALAGIGTAVTLYPVVKRQHEGFALGFVTARVLEAVMIFTGVVSLLSLVTLRQDLGGAAGANAAALVTAGASHVAIYKWTFLLSQSLMPGINALLLGSLMYRSRLVPRIIPVMGLIGAPFLICTVIATVFGAMKLGSPELAALPVAAWPRSRWLPGSSRSACGWSSRASDPPRSPPHWTRPARRPPGRRHHPPACSRTDTSALIAILRAEPGASEMAHAIESTRDRRISAANWLETAVVIDASRDPIASRRFDELVQTAELHIEPVTRDQARIARDAYRDFGKGSGHKADLNFGDCFAYALAKTAGEALLFKGNDFGHTDITPALPAAPDTSPG